MPEFTIPVMFDVTATDELAAALQLTELLVAIGLGVNRPVLLGREPYRVDSWWLPDPTHKTVDGNDRPAFAFVQLPADGDTGRDPQLLTDAEVSTLRNGLATAAARFIENAATIHAQRAGTATMRDDVAGEFEDQAAATRNLVVRVTSATYVALLPAADRNQP